MGIQVRTNECLGFLCMYVCVSMQQHVSLGFTTLCVCSVTAVSAVNIHCV